MEQPGAVKFELLKFDVFELPVASSHTQPELPLFGASPTACVDSFMS